jgi:2-keto-4-pentenoate hydratase/2-oxohepta-3-ene-1,7-dioic acid hydratase in catechol pathway
MKIVRYSTAGNERRLGILDGENVLSLPAGTTMDSLLNAGDLPTESSRRFDEISDQLLSPVEYPPSLRDFMSFEEHVVTSMSALGRSVDPVWYDQPVFYFSNPAAVIGPQDEVRIAPGSEAFDFELEIAAVIGRPGSDIAVEDAEAHIAGYALMSDWSARDLQEQEMKVGLGPAKGKDTATTIGPYLVTPDELAPYRRDGGYDVELSVEVNGRRYSQGNWSTIYWSFAQMVAYASRGTALRTGDVIGSGTVGTGCILELGRVHGFDTFPYLLPGDVVTVDGGPLGTFTQTVAPGTEATPLRIDS